MTDNPNTRLLERAREAGTLPQEQRRRELAQAKAARSEEDAA